MYIAVGEIVKVITTTMVKPERANKPVNQQAEVISINNKYMIHKIYIYILFID